VGSRAP